MKVLTIIWIIMFICVGAYKLFTTPPKPYRPTSINVDIDTLKEIKDIANDRSRNYSDLLDEISDKIDEIIEYDKTMHEVYQETNEESRQGIIEEQLF